MATYPTLTSPRPHTRPTPAPRRSLLVLWHLLSLDAPTVAALWTGFIAHTSHIHLPLSSIAAMAIAVWLLYASDRLLDARSLNTHRRDRTPPAPSLEARHLFHHRHRRAFMTGIAVAALLLAILLPTLPPGALRLYLTEGSFLAGYFILVHATTSAWLLPKELAVGLFFAAATFIPTIARAPTLRLPLLPPAILLAALCSLNCLFIYAWEHASPPASDAPPVTCIALRHLHPLALTLIVTALITAALDHQGLRIALAICAAAILLLTLHRFRHTLPSTTLRAAADATLLTPLLFLFQ